MGIGLGGFDSTLAVAADTLGLLDFGPSAPIPGSSLEIQEKGGRRIILRDRAVPFQEVDFGVEQRTKKTIYAGRPDATIQILGIDNTPTELEGEWNARFFLKSVVVDGDSDIVQTPAQACAIFDRMVRTGKQIRVQWLHFVRVGVLKSFVPTCIRYTDYKWKMSFEWAATDDAPPARARLPGSGFGLSDFMKALNFLEDCLVLGPMLARSLVASLVNTIKSIREKVSLVVQAFGAIEALINLPANVLGAIDAAIKSIVDECKEMIRRLSGPRITARQAEIAVVATLALSADPTLPAGPPGSSVTPLESSGSQQAKFEGWSRTTARAASDLRNQALGISRELHNALRPEAAKAVTVKEGETLWSIAAREYGSDEFANYIAQVNHLSGASLPAGTNLKIPARPYGATIDLDLTDTDVVDVSGNPGPCQV